MVDIEAADQDLTILKYSATTVGRKLIDPQRYENYASKRRLTVGVKAAKI